MKATIIASALSLTSCIVMASPKEEPAGWADPMKIFSALRDLDDFYGDVPSRINCYRPRNKAQTLICTDAYLSMAELYYSRRYIYMVENGTKRELDHKGFKIELPDSCTDKQCIYDFFKDSSIRSDDKQSPYYKPAKVIKQNFSGHFTGTGDGKVDLLVEKLGETFQVNISTSVKNKCSGNLLGYASTVSPDTLDVAAIDKTCHVTIRYHGNDVTTEESGCLALHGVECAFNGKLTRK